MFGGLTVCYGLHLVYLLYRCQSVNSNLNDICKINYYIVTSARVLNSFEEMKYLFTHINFTSSEWPYGRVMALLIQTNRTDKQTFRIIILKRRYCEVCIINDLYCHAL